MDPNSFIPKKEYYVPLSSVIQAPSAPIRHRKRYIARLKRFPFFTLFKLSLAALPTIIFGIFTIVFTLQQDASARATRQQDQHQADETNRRIIFKEYIDAVQGLLLEEHFHENQSKLLLIVRMHTLTVLRHLDGHRKRDVILFLYENGLLRHDRPPNVDLRGANLNEIKFVRSSTEACDLGYLYLPGVYAEKIVFNGCSLEGAIFENSSLVGARFDACYLMRSSFSNANLTRSQFHDSQLYATNFTDAVLVESSMESGFFQQVDFTNADLHRNCISDQLLNPVANGGTFPNIFLNTRFPNGSFSEIDTKNLATDGRAEPLVRYWLAHSRSRLCFSSANTMQHLRG